MRILVTGGAGFLGSFLCERLVARGDEVICLDNFFTGSKDNVATLQASPRFELIRHDIVFPIFLEVDQIYNLACPASPVHYQYNAIKTIKANVLGSLNMLGMAKRVGARILQASTSEVYGDPEVHPQTEGYRGNVNPIGSRACYDEGKRAAETLFFDYHRAHGLEIRVARIFNTYGPRMRADDGRVVSNFIASALAGAPLTLYGDGSQTRSFCYVDDLVAGLMALMDHPSEIGPVNLGNPEELSVAALAAAVLAKVGGTSQIERRPLPEDDPTRRRPDITRARQTLGWAPTTPLSVGLDRTIECFRARPGDGTPLGTTLSPKTPIL
jgi:UDP-glucuronate decarboxylase